MKTKFELEINFEVSPTTLYQAWLDSEQHSKMTGGVAQCSKDLDGVFSAWDGHIEGKNLFLETDKKIVQEWRTSDFGESDDSSKISLLFEGINNGCKLTLIHEEIPEGQPDYEMGWKEHYFEPMVAYFNKDKAE